MVGERHGGLPGGHHVVDPVRPVEQAEPAGNEPRAKRRTRISVGRTRIAAGSVPGDVGIEVFLAGVVPNGVGSQAV